MTAIGAHSKKHKKVYAFKSHKNGDTLTRALRVKV
jgi:hypothetical protein